ncbi:MAG: SDR family NAD(P)-dependent oxidoreductase, partial [Chitinophagaceae bacterium]
MEAKNSLKDLAGKIALVTGGTKGIGKAIADRLAEAGATVIVTARNQPATGTSKHYFIPADVTDVKQVDSLAKEISDKFGKIDILINNVGGLTTPGGGFSTLTDS